MLLLYYQLSLCLLIHYFYTFHCDNIFIIILFFVIYQAQLTKSFINQPFKNNKGKKKLKKKQTKIQAQKCFKPKKKVVF